MTFWRARHLTIGVEGPPNPIRGYTGVMRNGWFVSGPNGPGLPQERTPEERQYFEHNQALIRASHGRPQGNLIPYRACGEWQPYLLCPGSTEAVSQFSLRLPWTAEMGTTQRPRQAPLAPEVLKLDTGLTFFPGRRYILWVYGAPGLDSSFYVKEIRQWSEPNPLKLVIEYKGLMRRCDLPAGLEIARVSFIEIAPVRIGETRSYIRFSEETTIPPRVAGMPIWPTQNLPEDRARFQRANFIPAGMESDPEEEGMQILEIEADNQQIPNVDPPPAFDPPPEYEQVAGSLSQTDLQVTIRN